MTLRLRLVAIIGLSLTLLWTAVALWMFMDVRQQLRSALDERLAASARMVAGLVARLPAERLQLGGATALPLDVIARDGLACEVSLVRGEVAIQPVARTAASPGLEGATLGYSTRVFGGKTWRTYVLQDGEVRIATADRMDAREGLLREIALSAAVPFAVAMAGSLVLLWIGVGRGLAPIERVRAALLNRRVDADVPLPAIDAPPELQPLIDTIAHLLLRVQDAIEHERRFTDDAAHELRTPLTAIKTHLQVLRLACGEAGLHGAAGEALANAQRGVARLHRTLEQLLLLARLEGAASPAAPVCVDALQAARQAIGDAMAGLPHDGAAAGVRVELQTQLAAARLAVPEALLVSALRNLLDNALRHSPREGSVVLRIEQVPGRVEFCILDEGPGMNAAERAQAAQRFWRRGSGHVDGDAGSGLGLSIVEAIARRHGGELRLRPRQGAGLEARLCFPADAGHGAGVDVLPSRRMSASPVTSAGTD
ncbi:MAG: ATP-binding protein [Burkholderiaceae bacterium]